MLNNSCFPFLLLGLSVLSGCQPIPIDVSPRGLDASADAPPVDRVVENCHGVQNRVLYACTVPESFLYLGSRQVRLAQFSLHSCGVRITPRSVHIVLGRDPFPGVGGFQGLVVGSRGTDYFPNLAVLDGMRNMGASLSHRVVLEYDNGRWLRVELPPIDIQNGQGRTFFLVSDISPQEDRPGELVGPQYRAGFGAPNGGGMNALEIVDAQTGSRVPEDWLFEASWSNGCFVPREHFTIVRSIVHGDAGR
ncbi:hypothetical protein KBD34_00420 [Patescibacteria group bacterium]|nr:hypothetical protein [Patescibacteria group bacterium]